MDEIILFGGIAVCVVGWGISLLLTTREKKKSYNTTMDTIGIRMPRIHYLTPKDIHVGDEIYRTIRVCEGDSGMHFMISREVKFNVIRISSDSFQIQTMEKDLSESAITVPFDSQFFNEYYKKE